MAELKKKKILARHGVQYNQEKENPFGTGGPFAWFRSESDAKSFLERIEEIEGCEGQGRFEIVDL